MHDWCSECQLLMLCPQCFCFLQGEHGTGRNVAPFVEMEWGSKAYDLMWELKHLFDPTFVLNPGVVLNKVGTPPLLPPPPLLIPKFARA